MKNVTPAGHNATVASKAYAAEPASDLEKAFRDFCELVNKRHLPNPQLHEIAENILPEKISIPETHALFMEPMNPTLAGIFLSAIYSRSPQKVVEYDIESPLNLVGYRLPKDKLLINRGTTGNMFGYRAHGVVVSCTTRRKCAGGFLSGSETGIVVESGKEVACLLGRLSFPPENLRTYLEELVDICAGSVDGIYERYGKIPARTIRTDVRKMLGAKR